MLASMPRGSTLASRADRFDLYQRTVQDPPASAAMFADVYRRLRGREAKVLREDFCGAAAAACQWARLAPDTSAIAIDIDAGALRWGREHNLASLTARQRARVRLIRRDVLRAGPGLARPDVVVAMNNSWAVFEARSTLLRYLHAVRSSLARDGVFILQHFGGPLMSTPFVRRQRRAGVWYEWTQDGFNAITSTMRCSIGYGFKDGSWLRPAFEYHWRVWGLAEVRDILHDAGFADSVVLWPDRIGRAGGTIRYSATRKAAGGRMCTSCVVAVP